MSITLGQGFPARVLAPEPEGPDPTDLRLSLVLSALEDLRNSLQLLPAPQVTIDAPDLSAVVNAVNALRPGVIDPKEIGEAVADALIPMRPAPADPIWQDKLLAALDKLDYRMKAIGSGGIGAGGSRGGVLTIDTASMNTLTSTIREDNRTLTERMFAKAPQAGYTLWLDTADTTYIYMAEAAQGSLGTDAVFSGIRVTKDASGNPLGEVQIASPFAWNSRASASWA